MNVRKQESEQAIAGIERIFKGMEPEMQLCGVAAN